MIALIPNGAMPSLFIMACFFAYWIIAYPEEVARDILFEKPRTWQRCMLGVFVWLYAIGGSLCIAELANRIFA